MASQKGLGKGLGALLGDFTEVSSEKSPYQLLPIYKVEPNPDQPRRDFDEDELQNLSDSIAEHGVLLMARNQDQQLEIADLKKQLAKVKAERQKLETKVTKLEIYKEKTAMLLKTHRL